LTQHSKFFPRTTKNRLPDPSKICAFDFKGKFGRFGICSVSATIGINRSIFVSPGSEPNSDPLAKKRPSAAHTWSDY
jgi:hypothetical protein